MKNNFLSKIFIDLLLFIIAFAGLWAFFTWLSLAPKKMPIQLSIENEEKIGKLMTDNMLKNEEILHLTNVDSAINSIVLRLDSSLVNSKYHYKFYVIKKDDINAFALPGGNIIIYSGLLKFSGSAEEVAGVIAHEMGHIEHRDVVSRMMKEIGLTVFFSVLLKQNQNVITQVGKSVLSTAFDRNQEALADEFAFKLLSESGIKPTVLATFFQRLMKQNDSSNSKLELIMTHPLDSKRIKAASDYKIPKYFREKKINEQNWKKIKQAI